MIEIGRKGRILSGDKRGWYIRVQDDIAGSGGYLVITAHDEGFSEGFDDWVESLPSLEKYFEEAQWVIKWL